MPFKFEFVEHTVPMIWEGCVAQAHETEAVAEALTDALQLRSPVHVMGCTKTLPNPGETTDESGGRIDLFFAIADDDVPRAAAIRLRMRDMRWAMDADPRLYSGPARRVVEDAQ